MKDNQLVYSSNVYFFRESEKEGFKHSETPFLSDVIAVAAPYMGRNGRSDLLNDWEKYDQLMIEKIRALFQVAVLQGVDCLVLSALGYFF